MKKKFDLKIVILTDKKNVAYWEYAKFLPHCWSDDKTVRFFATNQNEYKTISNHLEEEFKNRIAGLEKSKYWDKDEYNRGVNKGGK